MWELGKCLGQKRGEQEERYFIKFYLIEIIESEHDEHVYPIMKSI